MSEDIKPTGQPGMATAPAKAHRNLGPVAIAFMVLAAAAPLTAATGVLPLAFLFSNNAAAPLYFLVAALLLAVFAVGFVKLSKSVRTAGAFYSYIEAGLGRLPGNAAAVLAVGAYGLTSFALTAYFGPFASQLVGTFTDWDSSPAWLWSLIAWAAIAVLGYRDIELSSKVLGVLLVCESGIILVLNFVILFKGGSAGVDAHSLSPTTAFGHGSPGMGIMWAMQCFVGFEATAVFRDEARNPDHTIPRATFGAIAVIGVLYALTGFSVAIGAGQNKVLELIGQDPSGSIFVLANEYVSKSFGDLMNVFLLGSVFACGLSFHNVATRYQFNMSRGGILPPWLGRLHPKHGVPSLASALLSGCVVVALVVVSIIGLDPVTQVFAPVVGILSFAVLSLMAFASLAAVVYFRGKGGSVFATVVAPALAFLGIGYVLVMAFKNVGVITGSHVGTVLIVVLMIALPLIGVAVGILKPRASSVDAGPAAAELG